MNPFKENSLKGMYADAMSQAAAAAYNDPRGMMQAEHLRDKPREGEVIEMLRMLSNEIDNLHQAVNVLGVALTPVLRVETEGRGDNPVPMQSVSPLGQELEAKVRQLHLLRDAVSNLHRMLAL